MKKTCFTPNIISLKILLFIFLFSGCAKNDLNIQSNSEPSIDLLDDIIIAITNKEYSMSVGGDMGMSWSKQIAKTQYTDEALYNPRESVIQSVWDVFYEDVVFKSSEMYDLALSEGNENVLAISLVLKAYGFSRLTDLYGDIPLIGVSTTTPVYDLQEEIYPQIFDMLDTAISLFNNTDLIDNGSDILYSGDANKWLKFANSLKFRCLMRVSSAMPVEVKLQELINNSNLFQSNEDEAKRLFSSVIPDVNPIYKTIVYDNRAEWRASSTVVDMQHAYSDPRLPQIASLNDDGIYLGTWTGNQNMAIVNNASALGELYLSPTLPAYLLSYAELEFLMAEAAQKGFISGSASMHYEAGMAASFEANEVVGSSYIAANLLLPSTALEQIGTEKWTALYTQGIESWTEWRRTGFPTLSPYPSPFLNEIPSRLFYPNSEQLNNTVNYNNAVLSQGEDNLTTPIWWMQ